MHIPSNPAEMSILRFIMTSIKGYLIQTCFFSIKPSNGPEAEQLRAERL